MSAAAAPRVKVCGLTRVDDAERCVSLGVHTLGLNFWDGSPRRATFAQAADIVDAVGGRARLVAVLVDPSDELVARVRDQLGLRWLQLHGDEPPARVAALGPEVIKAVRVGGPGDVPLAMSYGGEELLVDARVPGAPGGTGVVCDWPSAAALAAQRKVWLAGGLRPENVAEAVAAVRPWGVDVASGVERSPGVKDARRLEAFVRAARG